MTVLPTWLLQARTDIAGAAISVVLLIAYHVWLRRQVRRNPAYTIQAVNALARSAWVESIMSSSGKDVLAVQTLRNSTMAATFLASTGVLLIIGTLTLSGQASNIDTAWHKINIVGSTAAEVWVTKLIVLVSDFFVAFFSFSMAIRFFNHVGYLVNVPAPLRHDAITPRFVAAHLNRAGRYYSIGMRAYYFSVPLVFWLFGPHLMVAASIGLVIVLYRLDRAR